MYHPEVLTSNMCVCVCLFVCLSECPAIADKYESYMSRNARKTCTVRNDDEPEITLDHRNGNMIIPSYLCPLLHIFNNICLQLVLERGSLVSSLKILIVFY
jgi:hypothetical protein